MALLVRLGLLGAGGIAREVVEANRRGLLPGLDIVGVVGSSPSSQRARELARRASTRHLSLDELLESAPEWVLEAAGSQAVEQHIERLLAAGTNLVLMSTGALIDEELRNVVLRARARGVRVVLPSGAIGGLDILRAMAVAGEVHEVSITTTKAPRGLRGAPYLVDHDVTLPDDRAMLVFEGTAREAVRGFPANVNVAAALSLAGSGPDRTRVRIISDPHLDHTRHEIRVASEFGVASIQVDAVPSPSNPRSSRLAAASAIEAIREILMAASPGSPP